MTPVDEARARRLVEARRQAGLERADVVKALGLRYSTYGNYEDARRNMKPATAKRLASFLRVNYDWFQEGLGPMKGGKPDPFHGLSPEGRQKAIAYIEDLRKIHPG